MIHLGDITKIDGHKVPLVDIVTGGSPCQDLSVAGKRAGLAGERSGLFMEQMRIIKEMRDESTNRLRSRGTDFTVRDIKPRFMVWENVPGAFSSNKARTSGLYLKKFAELRIKPPMFLDLRTESGVQQAASWETVGPLLGEYTTRSFGESPSEEKESRLSQILEDRPHQKYCLSEKACQGILNRANRRGKKLPEQLEKALIRQSVSKNEPESQGGARDCSSNEREQVPCQHSTINQSCSWDGSDISHTLTSQNSGGGRGCQTRETLQQSCAERDTVYCLQGNGIDRADTAGCNGKGWRENQSYTLNTIDRPAVLATSIDEKMGNTYVHEEKGNTLSARDYKQPQAVYVEQAFGSYMRGGVQPQH